MRTVDFFVLNVLVVQLIFVMCSYKVSSRQTLSAAVVLEQCLTAVYH